MVTVGKFVVSDRRRARLPRGVVKVAAERGICVPGDFERREVVCRDGVRGFAQGWCAGLRDVRHERLVICRAAPTYDRVVCVCGACVVDSSAYLTQFALQCLERIRQLQSGCGVKAPALNLAVDGDRACVRRAH